MLWPGAGVGVPPAVLLNFKVTLLLGNSRKSETGFSDSCVYPKP